MQSVELGRHFIWKLSFHKLQSLAGCRPCESELNQKQSQESSSSMSRFLCLAQMGLHHNQLVYVWQEGHFGIKVIKQVLVSHRQINWLQFSSGTSQNAARISRIMMGIILISGTQMYLHQTSVTGWAGSLRGLELSCTCARLHSPSQIGEVSDK